MEPQQSRTRSRTSRVLDVLADGPSTLHGIAGKLGMVESRARYTLDQLRDEKKVFIGAWQRSGPRTVPIYHLGNKREVDPPKGARLQFLTNGYNYAAGSYLTAISLMWLIHDDDPDPYPTTPRSPVESKP